MSGLRAAVLSFVVLLSVLAGGLALGAGSVAATPAGDTYVVDTEGDCAATPTGNQEFSTITNAVENATGGETILVCDGTYTESVDVNKSVTIVTYEDGVKMAGNAGSLDTAFNVTASDVTIGAGQNADSNGFEIGDYGDTGISANDSANQLTINNSEIGELSASPNAGIAVTGADGVTIRNNTVGNLTGTGINLFDTSDALVTRNALANYSTGILAEGSTTSNLTVTENVLDGQDDTDMTTSTGIDLRGGGFSSNTPGADANIYLNVIQNNSVGFTTNTSVTDANGTRLAFNFFRSNDSLSPTAIQHNSDSDLIARQNYFGADNGPSGNVQDPRTSTTTDGDGQTTAIGGSGQVFFDPWLGKQTCGADQFTSAFDSIASNSDIPTEVRGVSIEAALPTCVWDRSAFPLRGTADSAVTTAALPRIEAGTSDSGTTDIQRDELVVYQQNQGLTLEYTQVDTVADTTKFAGNDTQLLVLEGVESTNQSDLLTDGSFDNSTGTTTLTTQATNVRVNESAGVINSSGYLKIEDTPTTSGPVTYVLINPQFGDGVTKGASDGTVNVSGGIDIIGVTSVPVQEKSASAGAPTSNVTAGNPAQFQPNSNLGPGNNTHLIAIYDLNAVEQGGVEVIANTTVDDVLAGSVSSANVTVNTSIRAISGTLNFSDEVSVDTTISGIDVVFTLNGTSTGEQSLVEADSVNFDSLLGSGPEVVNASATSLEAGPDPGTVNVSTDENFTAGTYQYIYLAQQGSGAGGFSTEAGTLNIEAPAAPPATGPGAGPGTGPGPGAGPGTGPGAGPGGGGGGGDIIAPGSPFVVVNVTVDPDRVEPGATTTVNVTVRNTQPNSPLLSRNIIVTVAGERRTQATVTLDPGETRTVEIPLTVQEEGRFRVEANGQRAGLLTVLPENVASRSQSRVFDQNPNVAGVQVRFPNSIVTRITFQEPANGTATVDELRQVPSDIPQPPLTLVTPANVTVPGQVEDQSASVRFRLQRSTIEDVNVRPETVQLARWNGEEWELLDTEQVRNTGERLTYRSETPGFSVFAVVGEQATATPAPPTATPTPVEPTPTDTPTDTPTATPTDEPAGPPASPPGNGAGIGTGIILGAVIVILLIAAGGAAVYLSQQEG